MNNYTEQYTNTGIQRLIKKILDTHGFSQYELSKRADLTPSTIYHILNKKKGNPPRRSTVTSLARAAGYEVTFDSGRKTVRLTKVSVPPGDRNDIEEFVADIRTILLRSGKEKFSRDEKQKMLDVIRVMVS